MATEENKVTILKHLEKVNQANTVAVAAALKLPHEIVVGAIKSIATFENVISVQQTVKEEWQLSEQGQDCVKNGSPEARLMKLIPADGIAQAKLNETAEVKALGDAAKPAFGAAMKNKWIKTEKGADGVMYKRLVQGEVEDVTQSQLQSLVKDPSGASLGDKVLKQLKRSKMAEKKTITSYDVSKGSAFTTTLKKGEADLTPEMLADGSWKTKDFKSFNLASTGTKLPRGTLHPLLKVREEYRQIFLEMGFEEMPTARFVESSFWNFDALFQPQQHPARDAHDTFFMSQPATSTEFPPDYEQRVKDVHTNGGFGSIGYKYDWDRAEAEKNLLRTHTTAVSARMLYKLAQQKPFKPVKYFSIDRVFRNETLDATHLAEFHQIEGLIADYNLTLGDLMGTLDDFFKRLGIENLRFKPAYNPYTEPSMEVFSYHAGLDKVVEIGNSGMFRPEMLQPMGLPEDVTVIAWGLSVERPTMIKYGYSNIRDLIGPKVDLAAAQNKPIVRL
eukprot:TRINITY_DN6167_c0_g1_i2.p1 TRINITY_DN6167_c0_g1~~TRINITY_DN6167_c0_g1_i2.p1  ORF type:complete len:503 (+),score=157.87 TRINITY_DN6167_c0_g1_i2:48-1556(+)